ncbi:MAG: SDR family oxidoreductase [Gammaproteobacteria bacterium]|nr:SDR family oxidoreductase [Gammaproteobacteria bacterium]
MFNLEGKVALVIGGRGRLGQSFCDGLLSHGADVIVADLASNLPIQDKKPIEHYDIDVTDPGSIDVVLEKVINKHKKIDILVYSVTGKTEDSYKPFTEVSLQGWRKIMDIELEGLFLMAQKVGKHMEQQGFGSMIFISSIYGVVANDHRIYEGSNLDAVYSSGNTNAKKICSPAVYNVVKAGVISLSKYLSAYWGDIGIRVNCISPGGISHPDENEDFVEKYSQKVPLGRKAGLNEMNGALVYLASDASSYVTGHNLVVDGGWTVW